MWAALLPDGELSQFERRILEVHLARCADCARLAEQVAAIVAVVRASPSEPMTAPVGVRGRPRFGWGSLRKLAVGGSAAAAAAAALTTYGLTGLERSSERARPIGPLIVVSSTQEGTEEWQLWRQTQQAERAESLRPLSATSRGPVLPMG